MDPNLSKFIIGLVLVVLGLSGSLRHATPDTPPRMVAISKWIASVFLVIAAFLLCPLLFESATLLAADPSPDAIQIYGPMRLACVLLIGGAAFEFVHRSWKLWCSVTGRQSVRKRR